LKLSRFKYCVYTDISRFFPSIYTHSIPWALNGKIAAKSDNKPNSATVTGNKLDYIVRQSQLKQTMGIAVGPDTSKIISELILCAVDEELINRLPKVASSLMRHVDDYWYGADSLEECELFLQALRSALAAYSLDLNDLKTRVATVGDFLADSWPGDIDRELTAGLRTNIFQPRRDVDAVAVLSKVIALCKNSNDEGIIKHVIRVIDTKKLWKYNWEVLEHFLAQCAVQFPHSIDYVSRVIAWRVRTGQGIDKRLWSDVAKSAAIQSASVGHDSEALWALWLCRELGVKVTKGISKAIIENCGSLVQSYLAHMFANGLTNDKMIGFDLSVRLGANRFSGADWPLALELNHLSIAPSGSIIGEHAFRFIHSANASLIEWNAPPRVFSAPDGSFVSAPAEALEDIGFDYGDDELDDDDEDLSDFG
jgi:hypothetical protein